MHGFIALHFDLIAYYLALIFCAPSIEYVFGYFKPMHLQGQNPKILVACQFCKSPENVWNIKNWSIFLPSVFFFVCVFKSHARKRTSYLHIQHHTRMKMTFYIERQSIVVVLSSTKYDNFVKKKFEVFFEERGRTAPIVTNARKMRASSQFSFDDFSCVFTIRLLIIPFHTRE